MSSRPSSAATRWCTGWGRRGFPPTCDSGRASTASRVWTIRSAVCRRSWPERRDDPGQGSESGDAAKSAGMSAAGTADRSVRATSTRGFSSHWWWAVALLLLAQAAAGQPLRVLFIGNSLTAANDLPAMVETLGKANTQQIVTRTVAFPNYSLEDHWQRGDAQRAIAEGGWSFVVFQQGPSALDESRVLLLEFARRLAGETRRVHARTAFY